jgi:hypothetical protein
MRPEPEPPVWFFWVFVLGLAIAVLILVSLPPPPPDEGPESVPLIYDSRISNVTGDRVDWDPQHSTIYAEAGPGDVEFDVTLDYIQGEGQSLFTASLGGPKWFTDADSAMKYAPVISVWLSSPLSPDEEYAFLIGESTNLAILQPGQTATVHVRIEMNPEAWDCCGLPYAGTYGWQFRFPQSIPESGSGYVTLTVMIQKGDWP